jgi:hypothetical protein
VPLFGDDRAALPSNRKLVSKAVRVLRDALGWPGSVRQSGSTYRLDESVTWRYDIDDAIRRGEPITHFMTGVYNDWALERARTFQTQTRTVH